MTDVQPKGLIPQLTDVLYALTDSHELLLFNLRALRRQHDGLGHTGNGAPSHAADASHIGSFRAEPIGLAQARPPALVDTESGERNGRRDAPLEEIGRTNGPEAPVASECDGSSVVAETSAHTASEIHSPIEPENDDVAPTHERNGDAPEQSRTEPTPPVNLEQSADRHIDSTQGASVDRNYNFFDELDARLTRMKDHDLGSEKDSS